MRTEEQSEPSERYLLASEYFSDAAICFWQSECIKRCKDKGKEAAYYQYIAWKRQDNEIAIYTHYAYANLKIPKKLDVIFEVDRPDNFLHTEYELSQSIHEAWFPLDIVEHGHKHLCVFRFNQNIPNICNLLHKREAEISTSSKRQSKLGFCESKDFELIKSRLNKIEFK